MLGLQWDHSLITATTPEINTSTPRHMKSLHKVVTYFYVTQNDVKQRKLSACLIEEYRVLWLQLSKLASETGKIPYKLFFQRKCLQLSDGFREHETKL
jgi:hypothetical protein